MMSHACASRTGVAGTLLATGWLLVALNLAPIASGVALRVEGARGNINAGNQVHGAKG